MRMSAVAFGAVTIGLGVAISWHLRPSSPRSQPVAPPARALSAESPAPSSLPRRAAETTAHKEPAAESATDPIDSAAVAPAPLPGRVPVTPMAQLIESSGEDAPPGLVQEEQAFSAERVDTAWAPGAEANILARFAQTGGLALTNLEVECRSTMCRLQVASPISPGQDPGGPAAVINAVGFKPRWVIGLIRFGTLQSVAYLPREGIAQDRSQ